MTPNIMKKRNVVISFVLSAAFGVWMVVQGLFVQAPISNFDRLSQSAIQPKMDFVWASKSWHPEWFRARVFYVDTDFSLQRDISKQLHKYWIFVPSLDIHNMSIEAFRKETPEDRHIVFEFVEAVYLEEAESFQLNIQTDHPYQVLVNDDLLMLPEFTLSKGLHRFRLRVLLGKEEMINLSVKMSKDNTEKTFLAAQHHAFRYIFGGNRTSLQASSENVFQAGSANFRPGSDAILRDLWFGINEGRFFGRVVIEVHNRDGGMSLAQKRALALAKWFVEKGAPSKLITVQGYGGHWLEETDEGRISVVLLH